MITLKIKAYNKHEVEMMLDVISEGLAMVMSINCTHDCISCEYKHICRDLDEAEEYVGATLANIEGK